MSEKQPLSLAIEGMHCGGCVNRVKLALSRLDGVTVEQVEVGTARVRYDAETASPAAIEEAINRIGFTAKAQ